MNKSKLTISLVAIIILFLGSKGYSQQEERFPIDPIYYTVFDPDSLKGFDESAARASAISEQFFGSEFKIKMYRLKREYIDNKYNLQRKPAHNDFMDYLSATRPAAVAGCVNEDFEASAAGVITTSNQVVGWTITGGYNGFVGSSSSQSLQTYFPNGLTNANSCNLTGCCPMPPTKSAIIDCSAPGGFIDLVIGSQYPIFSVFGTGTVSGASTTNTQISQGLFGTKVLRLNDELNGDYSIERLSKTFSVTSSNALFQFAFISVFAPGHGCCDAGGFQIKLSNASANTVIPCPNFSVSAPSSQCTGTVPASYFNVGTGTPYNNTTFNNIYHPWKINSMDLTAYIGQNITIDIIVSDCNAGGHFGCIYFDAQCGPMTIYGNGNPYDAGTNVTVPTCGASGATICAADGLGPYSWSGPNLPTAFTIPSATNQCITTSVSAQYTLYMQPAGSCAPISRIVNSTITPAALLNASVLQAQCGSTLAIVSATPSGSASNPAFLSWSPTPLSLNSSTTIGTYTLPLGQNPTLVSILASDPLGCKVTATVNINPAPPIPSFTIVNSTNSNSITCQHPFINLDAATTYSYNGGSLNYFWSSASTTFATNSVTIVNPGTYTVTGVDPVTNCGITNTVNIGINVIPPVSVMSPSTQNITCSLTSITSVTLTANPTVNVTHEVFAPQGGVFSSTSFSTAYLPGGIGTFTYCLRNDINGCVTCKQFTVTSNQGFPTYAVTSPQNFTLGCNSTSCAVISIDNGNTGPPGGPVSYSILAPGSSTTTPNGVLSGINVYTVCNPGTYTVVTKDNSSFCETRVPISILQNTITPNMSALVERQVIDCNTPKVRLKGTSTSNNIEYYWVFQGSPNTQQGDTITAEITALNTQTLVNTYTLVINDLSSTCKSFSVIPIFQNIFKPKPVVTNGGTNALTCVTPSIVLTNQSSTGILPSSGFPTNLPVIGYLWEGPTPQEPKSNATTYLAKTTGIYTLTAKDLNNGCTSQTIVGVGDNRVYPDLTQSNLTGTLDCGAQQTDITVIPTDLSFLDYNWITPAGAIISFANGNRTLRTKDPGRYTVIVTNTVNGCFSDAEFTVINGSLTADFVPDKISGFVPLTVNFTNNSSSTNGNANILSVWNFGNGTTKTYSSVAEASNLYTQPGTYTISLYTSKGNCTNSKQVFINLEIPSTFEIPNVFTPNGDGINDLYFIKAKNLVEINAVIFDRWGHIVYQVTSQSGNIEWDGKNPQGKDVAEGTYFYTIKAVGKDDKTLDKKGTINLYR